MSTIIANYEGVDIFEELMLCLLIDSNENRSVSLRPVLVPSRL